MIRPLSQVTMMTRSLRLLRGLLQPGLQGTRELALVPLDVFLELAQTRGLLLPRLTLPLVQDQVYTLDMENVALHLDAGLLGVVDRSQGLFSNHRCGRDVLRRLDVLLHLPEVGARSGVVSRHDVVVRLAREHSANIGQVLGRTSFSQCSGILLHAAYYEQCKPLNYRASWPNFAASSTSQSHTETSKLRPKSETAC